MIGMPSRQWSLSVVAVLLLAGLPASAWAQEQPVPFECKKKGDGDARFSGFHLYEENDSLPLAGGDERYTQGLRAAVMYNRKALPCWAQRVSRWWLPGRLSTVDPALTLIVGQSLYTPRIITSNVLEANDRGFADFNYGGLELSATTYTDDRPWAFRHGLELLVGVRDHAGMARGTQGGLHALKLSRMPKGWERTDGPSLGWYAHYRSDYLYRYQPDEEWKLAFDVSAGPTVEFGNVRRSVGGHATLRLGWNLTGFAPGGIRSSADGRSVPTFELGLVGGVDGRWVPRTKLVQATPDSQGFEVRRNVHDWRFGAFLRIHKVRVSYVAVRRSPEFTVSSRDEASQRFGSATLSYEPRQGDGTLVKWQPGRLQLELGMGRAFQGPKVAAGPQDGVSVQTAVRVRTWRSLFLSLEAGAVAVEGAAIPDEPANRDSMMFRQFVVSTGWMQDVKVGTLGIRAGAALASAARIQTIRHPIVNGRLVESVSNADFDVAKGGWIAGAQFFPHIERHLTMGVDLTYHRIGNVRGMPGLVKPSYLKGIILVQLRTR